MAQTQGDASGLPVPANSPYRHMVEDWSPPPPRRKPVPPKEKAINSILMLIDEYGIISPHDAAPATRITGTGNFVGIPGEPGPMIYHLASLDCPILSTDFYLADSCDRQAFGERMSLDSAKQRGIACVVCLRGVAKARKEHLAAKLCRIVCRDIKYPNALLLRWRKDTAGAWRGLTIYETAETMICDAFSSDNLRQLPS